MKLFLYILSIGILYEIEFMMHRIIKYLACVINAVNFNVNSQYFPAINKTKNVSLI